MINPGIFFSYLSFFLSIAVMEKSLRNLNHNQARKIWSSPQPDQSSPEDFPTARIAMSGGTLASPVKYRHRTTCSCFMIYLGQLGHLEVGFCLAPDQKRSSILEQVAEIRPVPKLSWWSRSPPAPS